MNRLPDRQIDVDDPPRLGRIRRSGDGHVETLAARVGGDEAKLPQEFLQVAHKAWCIDDDVQAAVTLRSCRNGVAFSHCREKTDPVKGRTGSSVSPGRARWAEGGRERAGCGLPFPLSSRRGNVIEARSTVIRSDPAFLRSARPRRRYSFLPSSRATTDAEKTTPPILRPKCWPGLGSLSCRLPSYPPVAALRPRFGQIPAGKNFQSLSRNLCP
jgi:hypothetical protein